MADEPEAKGGAEVPSESGDAMHVHAPKPPKNWRELLTEIGVIVVGIVIAISLEQTVEFFHHQEQRAALIEALRRDGKANQSATADNVAKAKAITDWALAQAASIEHAGASGPLILHRMPGGFIGAPDAGVWPSAKASGVANLLPPDAQNWLEYLADVQGETFSAPTSASAELKAAEDALDQVIAGHAVATGSGDVDLSALSAQQRSLAAQRLREIAGAARRFERQILLFDIGNAFILTTPLDKLDSPEAGRRYEQIRRDTMAAHPDAGYAFGAV